MLTNHQITSSLCGFITQCRGAETRITSLCDELESLTSGLEAIDRVLKGRSALDLALVEDDLWKQCELALDDCHVTLNSLGVLVHKIKENVRVKAWAWRMKTVVNLNVYGSDLAAFRDKVHKSNWALQTMLQTINVSLSLRNNASQEAILFELDRLKSSIEEAIRASIRPVGGFAHRAADNSDARVARNLRNLAQAASQFHGAASSTASTIRDDSRGGAPWQAFPGADIDVSLMGDLPSFRRERVEEYVREGRRHRRSLSSSGLTSPSFSPPGGHTPRLRRRSQSPRRPTGIHSPRPLSFSRATESVTIPGSVTVATVEDDEDEDAEFERLFLDGLEELAKDRIKERDFDKAIEFLQEAMKREVGSKSDNEGFRNLQVQLALCYLLQHRWEMAEPIINSLAKNKAAMDAVVCNLLHSMALVHLSLYHFDKALTICREALMAKKKLLKREKIDAEDYAQTQGLLVMVYEMKGDWMHAEVYQSQIPANFAYAHPKDEVDFISAHPTLLSTILGDNIPDFSIPLPRAAPGLHELDGSGLDNCLTAQPTPALRRNYTYNGASPFKVKFTQQLKYENDTSKIAYIPEPASTATTSPAPSSEPSSSEDADDEASPMTSPDLESPVRRRLSRMFAVRRARPMQHVEVSVVPEEESAGSSSRVPTKPASKPSARIGPRPSWVNAMLGFRKPRNLLRKACLEIEPPGNALGSPDKTKDFKLLYMERMTHDNVEKVNDPTYRRQYWSPESFEHFDNSTEDIDAGSDDSANEGPRECLTALPEDPTEDGNFASPGGVPYAETRALRIPCPKLEDVQEQEEYQDKDDATPDTTEPPPPAELSSENVDVKKYWDVVMRARPTGVETCNASYESITPADMDFSENEALVLETTTPVASISDESGQRKRNARRTSTQPVDPLLQSISSVLASLSGISDAEDRHAVKLDLEIMALQFKQRFRDGLVNQDLQRAIDSLEHDAIHVPQNETDDSGYESMGSDKEKETEDEKENEKEKGEEKPIEKRVVVAKAKSPFADYARALRNPTEKPRRRATLATESCIPLVQESQIEQPHHPHKAQEDRLPLRKKFSFEKGTDEVVDPNHAVAALRALVESGEADAMKSAIIPSVHALSGVHQARERGILLSGSEVEATTAGSPCSPSIQRWTKSAVEEKSGLHPKWPVTFPDEEVAVQAVH